MLEGDVTRKLRKALAAHRRLKYAAIHRHVNLYEGGILDLSVSIGQFTIWIEVKMLGGKLTKLQEYEVARLGLGAMVVTFSKDGKLAIIKDAEGFGWMTFEQLVEEIVSRCVDREPLLLYEGQHEVK